MTGRDARQRMTLPLQMEGVELTQPLSQPRRGAIFFDRDGVLNVDRGYVGKLDRFEWIEGAPQAIGLANRRGFLVFVVTNQSGIARGYYDEASVEALHAHMRRELSFIDAHIDEFRYCPHFPGGRPPYAVDCDCRKPKPGMIVDLLSRWDVDPDRSLLVGDKESDIEAAIAAGIRGRRFRGGNLRSFLSNILETEGFWMSGHEPGQRHDV